jgi:hypothetical protein
MMMATEETEVAKSVLQAKLSNVGSLEATSLARDPWLSAQFKNRFILSAAIW